MIFATPPMRNQCFRCPGPLQKLYKISSNKKNSATSPPNNLNFEPQGASGWQHEPKNLPKRFLLGGRERPKNVIFAVRSCLGARMAPKSPQVSILEALLTNFESLLHVFETFFIDLFHFCLHLLWVEGATEHN